MSSGSYMLQNRLEPAPDRSRRSAGPGSRGDTAVAVTSHVVLGIWSVVVILPLLWV